MNEYLSLDEIYVSNMTDAEKADAIESYYDRQAWASQDA